MKTSLVAVDELRPQIELVLPLLFPCFYRMQDSLIVQVRGCVYECLAACKISTITCVVHFKLEANG